MEPITIYHNGICSKSKGALELLQEHNIPHEIRYYTVEPFSEEELKALLTKLGMPASALVRRNEPLFLANFEGKDLSEADWLDVLLEHPELIERPIVEQGDKAFIARPPERVLELLQSDSKE
jgi:arsenate reductase